MWISHQFVEFLAYSSQRLDAKSFWMMSPMETVTRHNGGYGKVLILVNAGLNDTNFGFFIPKNLGLKLRIEPTRTKIVPVKRGDAMLRLSKFADYGTQVMAYMAKDGAVHSASEVAAGLGMAAATVSKILKMLAREQLVASVLGAKGGYMLARHPRDISMVEIINAMDGPISITECSGVSACTRESLCSTRGNWQGINRIIQEALEKVSLAEMIKPDQQISRNRMPGNRIPAHHVVDVSAIRSRGRSV